MLLRAFEPDREPVLYAAELELRYRVLREPLGMTREQVTFAGEPAWVHIVALDAAHENEVVGCVLYKHEANAEARLRQMAVLQARQRSGLGAQLVAKLEEIARTDGIRLVTMHARESAVGFYERFGYETRGQPFLEVGLPHRVMEKLLRGDLAR